MNTATKAVKYNEVRKCKQFVRNFLKEHYTDGHLAALLAHLRDHKFSFYSCCCLIGIPTADHALQGQTDFGSWTGVKHYVEAKALDGAQTAEIALNVLGTGSDSGAFANEARIYQYLIPMVRAEIKRRDHLAAKQTAAPEMLVEAGA